MNRRAFSLAFHAIVKAGEVSAVSHRPILCVRSKIFNSTAVPCVKIHESLLWIKIHGPSSVKFGIVYGDRYEFRDVAPTAEPGTCYYCVGRARHDAV